MSSDDRSAPDLLDSRGRLRRLAIALVLAAIAGALAYSITTQLSEPERQVTTGAYRFVYYVTAFAAGGVFFATVAILNTLAKKQYREALDPPPARVVEPRD